MNEIESEIARMNTPERADYVAARFAEQHNRVQELKAEIKKQKIKDALDGERIASFPMVAGKGAPQYTFDVPADTQLALF